MHRICWSIFYSSGVFSDCVASKRIQGGNMTAPYLLVSPGLKELKDGGLVDSPEAKKLKAKILNGE